MVYLMVDRDLRRIPWALHRLSNGEILEVLNWKSRELIQRAEVVWKAEGERWMASIDRLLIIDRFIFSLLDGVWIVSVLHTTFFVAFL